jgi:hypothetical protein
VRIKTRPADTDGFSHAVNYAKLAPARSHPQVAALHVGHLRHDTDNPAISLAPLYDVLSTIALELTDTAGQPRPADSHLGQRVGGQADI